VFDKKTADGTAAENMRNVAGVAHAFSSSTVAASSLRGSPGAPKDIPALGAER
jgi:hypothetical protein